MGKNQKPLCPRTFPRLQNALKHIIKTIKTSMPNILQISSKTLMSTEHCKKNEFISMKCNVLLKNT